MINIDELGIIYTKPHYRIKRVNVQTFGPWTPLYQLEVKIRGRWIFVVREHIILDTDDGRLHALSRLKDKARIFDPKLGFYKIYGHQNHPLEEFDFREGGGFMEDFTELVPSIEKKWLWTFHGNHRHRSAAFKYLIWDRKLAGEIRRRLNERG